MRSTRSGENRRNDWTACFNLIPIINMTREEIAGIITQAVNIAVRQVVRELAPKNDEISRREACRCYGYAEINALINEGRISTRRTGKGRNSKILVSRAEILTALASYTAL